MSGRFAKLAFVCGALLVCGSVMSVNAQQRSPYRYGDGKEVYERICQACHMPNGTGAIGVGAYPALAGNPNLENPLYIPVIILNGLKSMPAFADLTNEEIANVTNYIRGNFGNGYADRVTPEQVRSLRPSFAQ